jgi:hypothetical protein
MEALDLALGGGEHKSSAARASDAPDESPIRHSHLEHERFDVGAGDQFNSQFARAF